MPFLRIVKQPMSQSSVRVPPSLSDHLTQCCQTHDDVMPVDVRFWKWMHPSKQWKREEVLGLHKVLPNSPLFFFFISSSVVIDQRIASSLSLHQVNHATDIVESITIDNGTNNTTTMKIPHLPQVSLPCIIAQDDTKARPEDLQRDGIRRLMHPPREGIQSLPHRRRGGRYSLGLIV